MQGFFITGTDTGVGKTYIATSLLLMLAKQGYRTVAMKPIATGAELIDGCLCNSDALLLQKMATKKLSYADVNPFVFSEPIAPHLAAARNGRCLSVKNILLCSRAVLQAPADYVIIEGAGGWLVPLNAHETMADLALAYGFPVILVVAIKLGCINQALLTLESMQRHRCRVAGWVANIIDKKMPCVAENIEAIKMRTKVPLLEMNVFKK